MGITDAAKVTKSTVKAAYRAKALALHPDKNLGRTTVQFQELQQVYEELLQLVR